MSSMFLWLLLLVMGGILIAMNIKDKSNKNVVVLVVGIVMAVISVFGLLTSML